MSQPALGINAETNNLWTIRVEEYGYVLLSDATIAKIAEAVVALLKQEEERRTNGLTAPMPQ